jgi:hypothetical protein
MADFFIPYVKDFVTSVVILLGLLGISYVLTLGGGVHGLDENELWLFKELHLWAAFGLTCVLTGSFIFRLSHTIWKERND